MKMHDLIIIGAGPAGLTAALYAGRYKLNSLILEKLSVGGQIILSPAIDNFPGFPSGIATLELMERFKKQVDEQGINTEFVEVIDIVFNQPKSNKPGYDIKTKDKLYSAKSIIIAIGAQPKRLAVEGEDKFIGRGVSYCGSCDGPLFKEKDIAVVGGGERAIEEAIFLSGYAKKVSLIHRRDNLRASKILQEKARHNPKIIFILDSVITEIKGQDKVDRVIIKNTKTNTVSELPCQGVFIFVGVSPNTGFLKNKLKLDESGFIVTDENLNTSITGVFACGDCRRKSLYQVITAASDGAVAAYSVHKYLL